MHRRTGLARRQPSPRVRQGSANRGQATVRPDFSDRHVRAMNILLVSLDNLRVDRVGCLGSDRGLTPNIDQIAKEGALFTRAFMSDLPTLASHTAVLSGKFGINTNVVSDCHPSSVLDAATPWLPALFRAFGYSTGAVDHLFSMQDWFVRGYDDYLSPSESIESPGAATSDVAFPLITRRRAASEEFFLFLHYLDPPFTKSSLFPVRGSGVSGARVSGARHWARAGGTTSVGSLLDDLRDVENAYLDYEVGRLFEHLDQTGALGDTVVILMGGGGTEMFDQQLADLEGERSFVGHVPLLIWAPRLISPTSVTSMISLTDIMPTALEILDLPIPEGLDGQSLLSIVRGDQRLRHEAVVVSDCRVQAKRTLQTDSWRYVRSYPQIPGGTEVEALFNLLVDPGGHHDVARNYPEVVIEMRSRFETWMTTHLGDRPDALVQVANDRLARSTRLDGEAIRATDPLAPDLAPNSERTLARQRDRVNNAPAPRYDPKFRSSPAYIPA